MKNKENDNLTEYMIMNNCRNGWDIVENGIEDYQNIFIKNLDFIDYPPYEFFRDFSTKQKTIWFQKIDALDYIALLNSDELSIEKKTKYRKWFELFTVYRGSLTGSKDPHYYSTVKEQLYVLRRLQKGGVISLNKIHQDISKQSKVLSFLLSNGEPTLYKNLGKYSLENHGLNDVSLLRLEKIFNDVGLSEIAKDIKADLDKK